MKLHLFPIVSHRISKRTLPRWIRRVGCKCGVGLGSCLLLFGLGRWFRENGGGYLGISVHELVFFE